MNVVACDGCGKVLTKTSNHQAHGWIDGAGVCPTCGQELCPDCARWDGNDECLPCRSARSTVTMSMRELQDMLHIAYLRGFQPDHQHEEDVHVRARQYAFSTVQHLFKQRT